MIGIIGLGFVGGSMYKSFSLKGLKKNKELFGYDKFKNGGVGKFEDSLKCDILFLALPTKYNYKLGQYDKEPIYETCKKLEENNYNGIIVIKSTVEPETTNKLSEKYKSLKFIHNPEFLTARTAFEDFHTQTHIVLGSGPKCEKKDIDIVVNFYKKLYPDAEISLCTCLESESMKSFVNCFYSVKVQFFTELYCLCEKNGCDYNKVKEMMLKNKWINPMHPTVPGPDGPVSYGGLCFPKDTNALNEYMKRENTPNKVLDACIDERNDMRKDHDNCDMKNILNSTNSNVLEKNEYINIDTINFNNLLDRDPIIVNNEESIKFLYDKKIIITGGTGSIGSEIIIQLLTLGINNLFLIDNSEFGHYYLKIKLKRLFPTINIKFFLRDIRDKDEINKIFSVVKPEIVFHVAAYKHVPIMEDNPYEAISTNVIGVKNIVDLSIKYNVEKFLFVSTDKAVNPTNIMGASKRISELYVLQCEKNSKTNFVITRFGNVLGSSGSVIPVFIDNINNNCNLELTHKYITRYFMSISEAASLVIKAVTIGNGGEILLFDMGKPVKIIDLAKKILNLSSKKLSINVTGLRPGEKLYEELLCNEEEILPTNEKNIMLLKNNEESSNFNNNYNKLINKYNNMSEKELRDIFKLLVPTFVYTP